MGNCLITRRGGTSGGGGGASDCYWLVNFYDKLGQNKLEEEYVQNGDDCTYGTTQGWNTLPGQSTPIANITDNISQNLTLYLAYQQAFMPLIPTMTSENTPSGTVTASGYWTWDNYSWYPYHAFAGTEAENNTALHGGWMPDTTNPGWIKYDFGEGVTKKFNKIEYYTLANGSGVSDLETSIEGMKSDGTFENCLKTGQTITTIFRNNQRNKIEAELNGENYRAIRITLQNSSHSRVIYKCQVYGE